MSHNNKILVIEDDVTMRTLLKTLLEIEGFSVLTFGDINIQALLKQIKTEKPKTILLDVHLQSLNGIDALKHIRMTFNLQELFIIISSGQFLEKEALEAGANKFLLKPYMPDELITLLKDQK